MRLLSSLVGILISSWLVSISVKAQEIVKFPASEPNESHPVLLRAELYRPAKAGLSPAAILMHGCGGWQPAVRFALHGYAEDLQKHGYVVLNLDSFGARYYNGDEMCASNAKLRDALEYRTADAFDAARYLRQQPYVEGRDIFLMGQSNGGSVVLRASLASSYRRYRKSENEPAFRGTVAFYPWCGVLSGGSKFVTDVQVFSGGRDDWVSARECTEVTARGAEYNVKVYPEAAHSFDLDVIAQRYAGFLIGKDPAAAADSRARMMAFFDRHLAAN